MGTAGPDHSFEPLTPVSFLERSGRVFADRIAVEDGPKRFTYAELLDRSMRLAGGLSSEGVGPGDRVAVLAPNTHMLLEAHFGVPFAGAVLVALNTRLTPAELGSIVEHSGTRILVHDRSLAETAERIAGQASSDIRLMEGAEPGSPYEQLIDGGEPRIHRIDDERSLLSLNYTSGTTGRPKGVMYHHRGAFLQALSMAWHARLDPTSVFLWTLPMFHCNGWCFPWAVTAAGAKHVCLPRPDPAEVWRHLRESGVTHFNAAPTVLISLASDPSAEEGRLDRQVRVCTGGAPPSPTLLRRLNGLGIEVTHLYGLTETFGPIGVCEWHPEWDALPSEEQAARKARQGVGNVASVPMRVLTEGGEDVPADGVTMGEISVRGNTVMSGYYLDPEATSRAVPDGWFRTGDLGVMHPDGYVELRDRAKDVIISGGENIASVEVEQAIVSHPAVLEVAVIAEPDDRWGEIPVAYVTLTNGARATDEEIIEHARGRIARFKVPRRVVFGPLPKTSTGKIQKNVLRDAAWAGQERRIH